MPDSDPSVQSPSDLLAFLQSGADATPFDGRATDRRDSIIPRGFAEGPPNLAETRVSAAVAPVRISALRHPKESVYFTISAIAGTLAWLCLIPIILMFVCVAIPLLIFLPVVIWIAIQRREAKMLGHSVKVGRNQFPEIFEIVERHCRALGITAPVAVFVVEKNGVQARTHGKYVELYSDLIDVMLAHNSTKELSFVIGHELGHKAAGHTALWKHVLLKPAMFIPFLGGAYFRPCELTADRIGLHLCGDKDAACRGLAALACGSKILSPKANLQAFKDQEREMPGPSAFLNDVYSTHPAPRNGLWLLRTLHGLWRTRSRNVTQDVLNTAAKLERRKLNESFP